MALRYHPEWGDLDLKQPPAKTDGSTYSPGKGAKREMAALFEVLFLDNARVFTLGESLDRAETELEGLVAQRVRGWTREKRARRQNSIVIVRRKIEKLVASVAYNGGGAPDDEAWEDHCADFYGEDPEKAEAAQREAQWEEDNGGE